MSLRRKMLVSNVLMVVLPVAITLMLCAGYIALGGSGVAPISRFGGDDHLMRSQSVLNAFEAGLSNTRWDAFHFAGEDGSETVLVPDEESIAEMERKGFHLQVDSTSRGTLFSNVDETDKNAIAATEANSDGSLAWYGSCMVIRDNLNLNGLPCSLVAVYNEARAEEGSVASLVPLYLLTPSTIALFVLFAILSTALVALALTRWLNRSVLAPLDELRTAAERVEAGELDRRIAYPKQDEIGEVCEAFDGMRKRLKQAETEKARYEEERRELLRGVSHDLRSPLTSIVGYASGIKDGIADTDEKRERYCDAILTRAADLERMVESLSVLTRADEEGMLHVEPTGIGAFLAEAIEDKRPWLESNGVEVSFTDESGGFTVMLDRNEMRRVVDNLLVNTVQHRLSESSLVRMSVTAEGPAVRIRYADDGPGVPEQHLAHIFESFYRADESRTKQGKGSGLGLAIVKRIVEAHGGCVSAENDGGLAVTMTLPLAEGDA